MYALAGGIGMASLVDVDDAEGTLSREAVEVEVDADEDEGGREG